MLTKRISIILSKSRSDLWMTEMTGARMGEAQSHDLKPPIKWTCAFSVRVSMLFDNNKMPSETTLLPTQTEKPHHYM